MERRWSGGGGGGRGGVVSKGRLLRGSEGSRGRAIAFLPPSAIEHRSLPLVYIRYESATAVKHAGGVGGYFFVNTGSHLPRTNILFSVSVNVVTLLTWRRSTGARCWRSPGVPVGGGIHHMPVLALSACSARA